MLHGFKIYLCYEYRLLLNVARSCDQRFGREGSSSCGGWAEGNLKRNPQSFPNTKYRACPSVWNLIKAQHQVVALVPAKYCVVIVDSVESVDLISESGLIVRGDGGPFLSQRFCGTRSRLREVWIKSSFSLFYKQWCSSQDHLNCISSGRN